MYVCVRFGVAGFIAHVLRVTLWGLSVVERGGVVGSIRMCAVLCSGMNCTGTESNIMELLVVERVGLVVSISMCAVWCSCINCTCTKGNIMGTVTGGEVVLSYVYKYVCCLV
jgi:hypothetical protein